MTMFFKYMITYDFVIDGMQETEILTITVGPSELIEYVYEKSLNKEYINHSINTPEGKEQRAEEIKIECEYLGNYPKQLQVYTSNDFYLWLKRRFYDKAFSQACNRLQLSDKEEHYQQMTIFDFIEDIEN